MSGLPSWARVQDKRRAHIERVVQTLTEWAEAMRVPTPERDRWIRAGYLHDALRDAEPQVLARLAPDAWGTPALRHGPAAARLAEDQGEHDAAVLSAVRYHSVGFAGWDQVGRMLYLADYLEPGRPERAAERAARAARVPSEPLAVLREIAAERLAWQLRTARPLIQESVDFWNVLVGSD